MLKIGFANERSCERNPDTDIFCRTVKNWQSNGQQGNNVEKRTRWAPVERLLIVIVVAVVIHPTVDDHVKYAR